MALTPTTRLGARYPNLAQAADLAFLLQTLAQDLDTNVTGFTQGTFAARPAAGKTGFFYWDSTNAVLWYDNGTIWIGPIGTPAAASITQAMLAPGAAAGQSYGTAFPTSSLYNGYRFTLFYSSPTGGTIGGDFVYRADLDATYPWDACDAAAMYDEVATNQQISSGGSYIALATAGPSVVLPKVGMYDVSVEAAMSEVGNTTDTGYMSYDIGGTGATDAEAAIGIAGIANQFNGPFTYFKSRRKTFASVVTLTSKYKAGGNNTLFQNRIMRVKPIKLG